MTKGRLEADAGTTGARRRRGLLGGGVLLLALVGCGGSGAAGTPGDDAAAAPDCGVACALGDDASVTTDGPPTGADGHPADAGDGGPGGADDGGAPGDGGSSPPACVLDEDCDDGRTCTTDWCDQGRCATRPAGLCPWPAEPQGQARNLTGVEGPGFTNDFHQDLSGAVWNPVTEVLWLCRNNDARIWKVERAADGSYAVASTGGRGEWSIPGDIEGITQADFDERDTVYVVVEGLNRVREYDLTTPGTALLVNEWDTGTFMPAAGNSGAEGITFVPDSFLAAQGFVDGAGVPYLSTQGMGGLMLVAHQSGGGIYAFDLNRGDGTFVFVGAYGTLRGESAALEFDRSTGWLFIWHGDGDNQLERARLSSSVGGDGRQLDAEMLYAAPPPLLFASQNHEGIAVVSADECVGGQRTFFITTDGGGAWSLLAYQHFPCD